MKPTAFDRFVEKWGDGWECEHGFILPECPNTNCAETLDYLAMMKREGLEIEVEKK